MRTAIVAVWISLAIPSIWAQHNRRILNPATLAPSGARAHKVQSGSRAARVQKRATTNGAAATVAQAPGVVQLEYLNGTVIAWFVNTRTIPKDSSLALSVIHENGSEIDCDALSI